MVGGEIGKMVLESIYTERLCIFLYAGPPFFCYQRMYPISSSAGMESRVREESQERIRAKVVKYAGSYLGPANQLHRAYPVHSEDSCCGQ